MKLADQNVQYHIQVRLLHGFWSLGVQRTQVEGKNRFNQHSLLSDLKENTFPSASGILSRLNIYVEYGCIGMNFIMGE